MHINSCQNQLNDKRKIHNQIKSICDNRKNWLIGSIIVFYLLYVVLMIILIFVIYDWNKMEPVAFICSLIMAALLFIPSIIKNKSIQFWKIPSDFWNYQLKKQCKKFDFHPSEINDLEEMIRNLNQQKIDEN